MSAPNAWAGNWPERVRLLASEKGYGSLREMSKKHPFVSYWKLAAMLGERVAALQVAILMADEAQEHGEINEYARVALTRGLVRNLIEGDLEGGDYEFKLAAAIGVWSSDFRDEYKSLTAEVGRRLMNQELVKKGCWRPNGPDDDVLDRVFKGLDFQRICDAVRQKRSDDDTHFLLKDPT